MRPFLRWDRLGAVMQDVLLILVTAATFVALFALIGWFARL